MSACASVCACMRAYVPTSVCTCVRGCQWWGTCMCARAHSLSPENPTAPGRCGCGPLCGAPAPGTQFRSRSAPWSAASGRRSAGRDQASERSFKGSENRPPPPAPAVALSPGPGSPPAAESASRACPSLSEKGAALPAAPARASPERAWGGGPAPLRSPGPGPSPSLPDGELPSPGPSAVTPSPPPEPDRPGAPVGWAGRGTGGGVPGPGPRAQAG